LLFLSIYYCLHHLFLCLPYKLISCALVYFLLNTFSFAVLVFLSLKNLIRRSRIRIIWRIKIRLWLWTKLFRRFSIHNNRLIEIFLIKSIVCWGISIYYRRLHVSNFALFLKLKRFLIFIRLIRFIWFCKIFYIKRFFKLLVFFVIAIDFN
jgi:hypothetical protein